MKKILILSNVLLLAIILFMACSPGTETESTSCSTKITMDYSEIPLEGVVNGDLIRSMSEAYQRDLGKSKIAYAENSADAKDDALSITFDLEKIKNFIWHMETSVCRANCKKDTKLGIRFYYIKYPQGVDTSNVPSDLEGVLSSNANKHALVMVPAYLSGNEWYDFNYDMLREGSCDFNATISKQGNPKSAGLLSIGSGTNHGGIGPPPEPGTYPTKPE